MVVGFAIRVILSTVQIESDVQEVRPFQVHFYGDPEPKLLHDPSYLLSGGVSSVAGASSDQCEAINPV